MRSHLLIGEATVVSLALVEHVHVVGAVVALTLVRLQARHQLLAEVGTRALGLHGLLLSIGWLLWRVLLLRGCLLLLLLLGFGVARGASTAHHGTHTLMRDLTARTKGHPRGHGAHQAASTAKHAPRLGGGGRRCGCGWLGSGGSGCGSRGSLRGTSSEETTPATASGWASSTGTTSS